jgi:hypothetical protein
MTQVDTNNSLMHLKDLTNAINTYNDNRHSFDKNGLQDIRDRVSLSLFYLSDFYSMTRADAEAAEFNKKLCLAQTEESLRGRINGDTNKPMNREQLINESRILCQSKELDMIEANRKYYKIRMIVETATQILNSIASRINQLN